MDVRKYFKGTFIALASLSEGPRREVIAAVVEGQFSKPNLEFESGDMLSLNVTNGRCLMRVLGSDSDDWIGHEVELFVGPLEYQGRTQEGVLLRVITPPALEQAKAEPKSAAGKTGGMDDDIPFAPEFR